MPTEHAEAESTAWSSEDTHATPHITTTLRLAESAHPRVATPLPSTGDERRFPSRIRGFRNPRTPGQTVNINRRCRRYVGSKAILIPSQNVLKSKPTPWQPPQNLHTFICSSEE